MSAIWRPESWNIPLKTTPLVQIDTEAGAAYVHVTPGRIVQTRLIRDDEIVVTIDLGEQGELIGFEVVGTEDFTLDTLLDYANIPKHGFESRTRCQQL
jgi:uncharacterized protein YuzE